MTCSWPIDRTCLPPLPELPDNPSSEQQAAYDLALTQRNAAEDLAVSVLWALSGRQFGACVVTVRPCPTLGWDRAPHVPVYDLNGWGRAFCGCVSQCVKSGPSMVHLPGPVNPATGDDPIVVVINGDPLDPAEYTVEGDVLYRRGGKSWPGQNLARPLGESGTWSVTYRRGVPAPDYVGALVGQLAKEFLGACGDGDCQIPRFLVSTSRQGVSKTFDPGKIIAAGMTGLPDVDQWLASVNPNRLAQPPVVL